MIHTYETRLQLNLEQETLISHYCSKFSHLVKIVWKLKNNQKLSEIEIYKILTTQYELTAQQTGSLISYVEGKFKALKELKKYELNQCIASIEAREKALKNKQKFIDKSLKKIDTDKTVKNKLKVKYKANQLSQKEAELYFKKLNSIDLLQRKIKAAKLWIYQKTKALNRKYKQKSKLENVLKTENFSLCFGSKKLHQQRPTESNKEITPYKNLSDWRENWDLARDSGIYSLGSKDTLYCNPEFHYSPFEKTLKFRLPDDIVLQRMQELETQMGFNFIHDKSAKASNLRMQCKYLSINQVEFDSHKGQCQKYLAQILTHLNDKDFDKNKKSLPKEKFNSLYPNQTALTYKIVKKKAPNGQIGFYLQVSFNTEHLNKINNPQNYYLDKTKGMLGLDFNEKGIAWTVVKPDGNRKIITKDNEFKPAQGFLHWDLKNKNSNQAKWLIENAVHQLTKIATMHEVAIAIENLDFSQKKNQMKAGYVDSTYNHMLSSLATSKFTEFLARLTQKKFINLYLVNPTYSSVGGFCKYGLVNHVKPDCSASHWLARQALFGEKYHQEENQIKIKLYREKVSLPYASTFTKQSKSEKDALTWREISRNLGVYRKYWPRNLHQYIHQISEAKKEATVLIDNLFE